MDDGGSSLSGGIDSAQELVLPLEVEAGARERTSDVHRSVTRRLTLMSFGFKFGPPPTNYYFDVSFLKNPARESCWDLFSSVTPGMREFVLAQPACRRFLDALIPMVHVLLECDRDIRVGIGCSAGRHRSAIVVEEIARRMERDDVIVKIVHREDGYQ